MPFDLPDIASKDVSVNTRKIYKTHLNKIAAAGYSTLNDLMNSPRSVIEVIDGIMPEPDLLPKATLEERMKAYRVKKRIFYSAIFYALSDTDYLDSTNPYYRAFQPLKDPYTP
jgi:hypothetical protein